MKSRVCDRKVLVVVAHPDDEILGCGGTMARHTEQGDEVRVLIMSEGQRSRTNQQTVADVNTEVAKLKESAIRATTIVGVQDLNIFDFPDNRFDSVDLLDIVKVIESYVDEFQPDAVYTHHMGDLNIDHRLTHEAVVTATRPLPGTSVETVLAFEVLSSTEYSSYGYPTFKPNYFINIDRQLERKLEAMTQYSSEIRDAPHPRSKDAITHLASIRGSMCGCMYAESFQIIRHVER